MVFRNTLSQKILSVLLVIILCLTGMNMLTGKELKGNTNISVFDEIEKTNLSNKKLTDISEIALSDGAKAATIINTYENDVDYKAALNFALTAYYKTGNYNELNDFKTNIDERSNEIIKGYEAAAKERAGGWINGYIPGETVLLFDENVTKDEICAIVEAEYGTCKEIVKLFNGQTMVSVDISLGQTVDMAVNAYEKYSITAMAGCNSISKSTDYEFLNDTSIKQQPYLDYIDAYKAWDFVDNVEHEKVLVGVIDTGVQIDHSELVNVISPYSADVTSDAPVLLTDCEETYTSRHGTFVSGIIAAEANNNEMIAGVASCYNNDVAEILAINASTINDEGKSVFLSNDIIKAINYCVEQNVKVINMSLGASGTDNMCRALVEDVRELGIIVVAAAGNESTSSYHSPSDFQDTIAVVATDDNNELASFTNYGLKKDICAPGVNIFSTSVGSTTDTGQGTSYSAPIVSAIVAMMCSVNSELDFYDARQILSDTSMDIGQGNKCKNGLVNAYEAVKYAYDFTEENRTKVNLAQNKIVTLSDDASLDENTYPVFNLVDGDEETDWISSTVSGKTITIDLEKEYVIDEIRIEFNSTFSSYFQTLISTNGTDWVEFTSCTTSSSVTSRLVDTEVTRARYVKFIFSSSTSIGYEEVYIWGYGKVSEVPSYEEEKLLEPEFTYEISESEVIKIEFDKTGDRFFYLYNVYFDGELMYENVSGTIRKAIMDKEKDEEFELKVTSVYRGLESEGVIYTAKMPGEHQILEPYGVEIIDLGNNSLEITIATDYIRLSNNYKYNIYINNELYAEKKGCGTHIIENVPSKDIEVKITSVYNEQETEGLLYYLTIENNDEVELVELASEKAAYSSSNEGQGYLPKLAIDNDENTRWASATSDEEWIYVDLGKECLVSKVILNWETAYGKEYDVQISLDGENWNTVATVTESDGNIDEVIFEEVAARYVKVQGITRATAYGYSLWDFEVYGIETANKNEGSDNDVDTTVSVNVAANKTGASSSNEGDNVSSINAFDANTGTRWSSQFTDDEWIYVDLGQEYVIDKVVLVWEDAYGRDYNIETSLDGETWTVVSELTNQDGSEDVITFDAVNARYVKMAGMTRGTGYGYSLWEMEVYSSVDNSESGDNTDDNNDSDNTQTSQLISQGKNTVTSSDESEGMNGAMAIDGNLNTRWASSWTDDEWIYVDLAQEYTVDKVVLNWEGAYGKDYNIEVSLDGETWTIVSELTNQDGGEDVITFDATSARYVKVTGIARGTGYGYSLWEMSVYGY